jgi:hypothetical protein
VLPIDFLKKSLQKAACGGDKPLQAREAGERPRDAKKKPSESSKKKPMKKKTKTPVAYAGIFVETAKKI